MPKGGRDEERGANQAGPIFEASGRCEKWRRSQAHHSGRTRPGKRRGGDSSRQKAACGRSRRVQRTRAHRFRGVNSSLSVHSQMPSGLHLGPRTRWNSFSRSRRDRLGSRSGRHLCIQLHAVRCQNRPQCRDGACNHVVIGFSGGKFL